MVKQIGNDVSPIDYVRGFCKKLFGEQYAEESSSVIAITFIVKEFDENKVKDLLEKKFKKDKNLDYKCMSLVVETVEDKTDADEETAQDDEKTDDTQDDDASSVADDDTDDEDRIMEAIEKMTADENKIDTVDCDDDVDELLKDEEYKEEKKEQIEEIIKAKKAEKAKQLVEEVDALIGAEEFKKLVHELYDVSPQITEHNTQKSFAFQSYLFSINDGCGEETYLEMLSTLLSLLDIYPRKNESSVYRHVLLPGGQSRLTDALDSIRQDSSRSVVCIDLRNWMNKLDDSAFKNFLFSLRAYEYRYCFVFSVPFVEPYALKAIEREIADVMYIKTVTFRPYNNDELKRIAVKDLQEFNYTCDDEALEVIFQRINEEKNYGRFYGDDTVKKVVDETIYTKQLANIKAGKDDTHIVKDDVITLCNVYSSGEKSGQELLDGLVGLDGVKKTLMDIIAQVKFAKNSDKLDRPCIHMRFTGNPGTGKTTVARILGLLMKEHGILRNGYFVECMARDLCGQYIGETAPRTQNKCRDAYGSVLFIDEAYSLYTGNENVRDYGKEALTALIAEMENHRDDLVVIMAGYTEDMKTLMDGNVGLRSRMPYEIAFPNYTRAELSNIFMSMAQKDFECEDGLKVKADEYFNALPDEFIESKEFSNARFVRNLFERTWSKSASRSMYENDSNTLKIKVEDFVAATAESEFSDFNKNKKATLGF